MQLKNMKQAYTAFSVYVVVIYTHLEGLDRNTKYPRNMTCLKRDFNDNSGLMPQISEGNDY